MLPAPTEPIPICVGGVSDIALRRAARNDGWISDLHTIEELGRDPREDRRLPRGVRPGATCRSRCTARPATRGTSTATAASLDAGVTHLITMPWYFYAGADADLAGKVDGIRRFADDVIAKW